MYFLDLSKAFDTLNHDILLSKLKYYGLSDTPLRWFTDYLSNRHQYIEINNIKSTTSEISMGVPQGSILGPLLFIIYMNDISIASELFQAILYADDTSLNTTLSAVGKETDSLNSDAINKELLHISEWLACNKLSLNVKKTKFMIFRYPQQSPQRLPSLNLTINNSSIERVHNFDFLGLTISETLSWKQHVNKVCVHITKVLAMMRKLKHITNELILLKVYNALILSKINYAILCWGYEHKRISSLQKKAIRIINKAKYNAHTDPIFKHLNLLKVKDVFILQSLKFYYQYENGKLPGYFTDMFNNIRDIHNHNTRRSLTIHIPRTRRCKTNKSARYSIPGIINNFPGAIKEKIRTHSFQTIKLHAKTFLIDSYQSQCNLMSCYVCGR